MTGCAVLRGFTYWSVPGAVLLLAACSSSDSPEPAADPTLSDAARADEAQAAELQQAVLAIESAAPDPLSEGQFYQLLDYYCGACHFPSDYPTEAVLTYFNDLDTLIERGRVIPGDADDSPLLLRMRRDQVPPVAWNQPSVSDVALDLVADFIDQLPVGSENPPLR